MRVYVINGKPTPLSRPRFSTQSNRVYDPQRAEKLVAVVSLMSQHNEEPLLTGPLHLDVVFYMPIPKAKTTKKVALYMGQYHSIKPDLSNMIKYIEDIANSIIYRDDALISSITAQKRYDINPRTEFTIKPIILEK